MRFVTLILVPILDSQRTVSVCLNFWDSLSKRYITDPRKLYSQAKKSLVVQEKSSNDALIPSKILKPFDLQNLATKIDKPQELWIE